jgi:hypothetical protein
MLHPLRAENLEQTPLRFGVVMLNEAEAFRLAICRRRFAHDDFEIGLFVSPVPEVTAVDPDGDRAFGC